MRYITVLFYTGFDYPREATLPSFLSPANKGVHDFYNCTVVVEVVLIGEAAPNKNLGPIGSHG